MRTLSTRWARRLVPILVSVVAVQVAVFSLAIVLASGTLAVALRSPSDASLSSASTAPRTILAFERVASDAQIASLLSAHGVTASAVFVWSSGLTGTHRTYVPLTPEALLAETRQSLIDSYTQSLQGNIVRLERFVAAHDTTGVARSEALQTEARSLLLIRAQLEQALAALSRGDAVAYAVEVTGSAPDRVASVARTASARVVDSSAGSGSAQLKPATVPATWSDPGVSAISADDLYERILAILEASGRSSVR